MICKYDVREWFDDLEDEFGILEFNERMKFIACRRMVDGAANVYLRTVAVHQYEDLKSLMLVEFGHAYTSNEVYDQLRARRLRTDETVRRYVIKMVEISTRATIP